MDCFKIINTSTDKFKLGGMKSTRSAWGPIGKLWTRVNHLKNHLRQYQSYKRTMLEGLDGDGYNVDDMVVVKYELREVGRIPLRAFIKSMEVNDANR
jgi:hypothetical protein